MKRILGNKKIRIILIAAGIILLAATVAVFLLRDRIFPPKEEEIPEPVPIEAPIQYALGEVKFLALPAGNTALVYDMEADSLEAHAKAIEEAAKEGANEKQDKTKVQQEDAEQETVEEGVSLIAYRYEGMADAVSQIRAYIALLTTEDMGFHHADETLKELEEPKEILSFDAWRGTAYLIYRLPKPEKGDGERQAIALCIDWERTACKVTAELVPENMTRRPKSPSSMGGSSGTVLTFTSAVDTVKAMHPSVLGLKGESMEEYRVYSRDGLVLIDGKSCMRIDIYKQDERTGTNTVAGNYFISSDGQHLYLFSESEKTVRELSMTSD